MGVVNNANLHGVKIRRAAIADCPSQTSDDENLSQRYYEPSICAVDGEKTVDAIENIGSGSIPVKVNSYPLRSPKAVPVPAVPAVASKPLAEPNNQ
jgi:hypothetical protein